MKNEHFLLPLHGKGGPRSGTGGDAAPPHPAIQATFPIEGEENWERGLDR